MVTYRLTEAELVAGNVLWRKYNIGDGRIVIGFVFIWLIALGYFQAILEFSVPSAVAAGFVVSFCAMFGVMWASSAASRRNTLHYFRTGPSASRDEVRLDWSRDTITFQQENGYQKLTWTDFKHWNEDETVFVFLRTGPIFYPVPKRDLSPQQLDDLRARLEQAGVSRAKPSRLVF